MKLNDLDCETLADTAEHELPSIWRGLFNQPAPSVPAAVLRQLLAYRAQERSQGKLKVSVRRELERLSRQGANGETTKSVAPRLAPGTRLVREWSDRTIVVDVLQTGFEFDGKTWNSLSEIARHVTGTHWSGPRFFGIGQRG